MSAVSPNERKGAAQRAADQAIGNAGLVRLEGLD